MLSGLGLQTIAKCGQKKWHSKKCNIVIGIEKKKNINIEEKEQQYTPQKGKLKSTLLQFICSER